MTAAQTYLLKIYDTPLAQFQFAKTLTGFRAQGLEVDASVAHLLPLNLTQAPTDLELARFLSSRRIPKGRVYLEEVLRPYGLSPTDTKGIIDLSRGTSVNDAYSVVPADDDIPYREYNLFDNTFDAVLQIIAYTGAIPQGVVGSGRPSDLTPSGTFPKTWRRIDGKLVLYKAGSTIAAPNYGKEPYAEALAWQVARTGGFNAIQYELAEWQGKVCSTCELFNTPDISFVPFELCLSADLAQLCDIELALAYFGDISAEAADKFCSMTTFDAIVANTDRHVGNFGVLRDNHPGTGLDMAPLFDNNVSLFIRDFDESLELDRMVARYANFPGVLDASLGQQGSLLAGESQRAQVERLADFSFDGSGFIEEYRARNPQGKTISTHRLEVLSAFVRRRAQDILR